MNKHHEKSKTAEPMRVLYLENGTKLLCYESYKYGEDYPIIVFDTNGNDLTDEFDAYDYETILHVASL
jgi:hypothetical protein